MLKKICFFVFLLIVNSSCSQERTEVSGYIKLRSEISSGSAREEFTPLSILTIDNQKNVLEFNEKLKRFNGKFVGSDTLNVFFINTAKRTYAAYKRMDINEKPYLSESIENKKEGLSFFKKDVDLFSDVKNIRVKDTLINGTGYKLAQGVKQSENEELKYEALIAVEPHNFPVQISKILSGMTHGGFVEKVSIIDKANDRIISFTSSYEKKELPKNIDEIMKAWSRN